MTPKRSLLCCLSVALVVISSSAAKAQVPDPRLCIEQVDPVAGAPFNLVDAFCIPPAGSIGNLGDAPANVLGFGDFPANDQGQLDIFVIWEPKEIGVFGNQTFTYSSSLSWSSDKPNARFKEWVGNFNDPSVPFAVMITDSDNPSMTPPEFSSTGTSATISGRTFDSSQFPPPVGRYHIQITGLDPGEMVTFSKIGNGGMVVPEPSAMLLALLGIASPLAFRRR